MSYLYMAYLVWTFLIMQTYRTGNFDKGGLGKTVFSLYILGLAAILWPLSIPFTLRVWIDEKRMKKRALFEAHELEMLREQELYNEEECYDRVVN